MKDTNMDIYYNKFNFPKIGTITIYSYKEYLVALDINERINYFSNKADFNVIEAKNPLNEISCPLNEIIEELKEYFSGKREVFTIKTMFLTGSEFQQKVWKELHNIPYGKTISYKELAQRINQPSAARAVGMANSKNPIPIIIPCHRVINKNGELGGFSCGIELKTILLSIESYIKKPISPK